MVLLARDLRNRVKHSALQDISTKKQFEKYWAELKNIAHTLLSSQDFKEFTSFKMEKLVGMGHKASALVTERIEEHEKEKISALTSSENRKIDKILEEMNQLRVVTEGWSTKALGAYEIFLILIMASFCETDDQSRTRRCFYVVTTLLTSIQR